MLQFRNVDASPSDDITTWPFEALATAIDRGLVADWQPIIAEIRRAPWGAVTRRVEHHLDHRDADRHILVDHRFGWRTRRLFHDIRITFFKTER